MTKQTFTTGQVLTAAQMTSLQQTAMGGGSTTAKTASYTLVAADAGTVVQMNSASATTITVNTALFAQGDSVQIQNVGVGVCTVTAGTATVSTSSTLALKQFDAGSLYFNTTSAAIFFATDAADGSSPLTTKGDLYGFSTLDARIPIGTNNQVLTADSAQALGLKWATPASGSMTQLATGTLSGATVTLSSISGAYNNLYLVLENWQCAAGDQPYLYLNTDTAGNYDAVTLAGFNNSTVGRCDSAQGWLTRISMAGYSSPTGSNGNSFVMTIFDYANTIAYKYANSGGAVLLTSGSNYQGTWFAACDWRSTAAVNQIVLKTATGSFGGGTYYLYGVK